jgi:transposase InsO family protein
VPACPINTPSDPRRRLRRHHYQEGPDFLFLASQGGRSVERSPQVFSADRIRRRIGVLQAEVLDRQVFPDLMAAVLAFESFVRYYNYHRLSGTLGWPTPAERYDGTPFTDLGFQDIPALAHLQLWLEPLKALG